MLRNQAMMKKARQQSDENYTALPRLESISQWGNADAAPVEGNAIAVRRDRADEIFQNQMLMAKVSVQMRREGGWIRWIFGIGKQQQGLSGSKVIHPQSPFSQIVITLSALLLLYSAVVSLTLVGFLWYADPCQKMPTLEFDMFVDIFFIFEIFITFFIGVFHQGEYKDSLAFIASRYLRSSFVFDIITSIPVSFIEYYSVMNCQQHEEDGTDSESQLNTKALRVIRALKPLKIARILRSIKFLRVLKLVSTVLEYFRIPPFVDRIFKVLVAILLLVHACACCYWLVKESSSTQEDIHEWLLSVGLKDGIDSSLYEKYVTCFYFVNTVFCTVGFGDISAVNSQERLFCVLLFYMGTLVFGMLLAEVQDALNKTRQMARERENTVQVMVNFCRKAAVPLHLEKKVVNWIEFTMEHHQDRTNQEELLKTLPPNLHRQLMGHLHQGMLLHTMPFIKVQHEQLENFCLDLWSMMKPALFGPFVPIAASGKPADRMYVIIAGTVILQEDGNFSSTLHPGETFGEYALFGQNEWGFGRTQGEAQFASITNVMCLYLTAERFNTVLNAFPADLREELEAVVADLSNRPSVDATLGFNDAGQAPDHLTRWIELAKRLLRHYRLNSGKSDFNQKMLGRAVIKMGQKNGKPGAFSSQAKTPRSVRLSMREPAIEPLASLGSEQNERRLASEPAMLHENGSSRELCLGADEVVSDDNRSPETQRASKSVFEEAVGEVAALASEDEIEEEEADKDAPDDGDRSRRAPPHARRASTGEASAVHAESLRGRGAHEDRGEGAGEGAGEGEGAVEALRSEWRTRAAAMEERMEALAAEVRAHHRSTAAEVASLTKAVSALVSSLSAGQRQQRRTGRGDAEASDSQDEGAGVRAGVGERSAGLPAVMVDAPGGVVFDSLGLQELNGESSYTGGSGTRAD